MERAFHSLDAHVRRRLRAMLLKQWKRKRFIVRKLIKLGSEPKTAWRSIYGGHRSLWALSHSPAVHVALRNAYFAERGLVSIEAKWKANTERIIVPTQLTLTLA